MEAIAAATHPPGYALHKYWARKPHNVVRHVLSACAVGEGDLVLDPFAGSGLPLSEAAALGARCAGGDVNPIAVELARVTLDPPDPDAYAHAALEILREVERLHGPAFAHEGAPMRYAVHATVVACPTCGARVGADEAARVGRRGYACPRCGARVAFNLQSLVATRIVAIVRTDGRRIEGRFDAPVVEAATDDAFDRPFEPNARVLAHPGMRTRDLFTSRTFAALSAFGRLSRSHDLRRALAITLTGAVAQCSRLIAWRNDLRTGGPAWTVPGFWVPPLHLESNPIVHLRARIARVRRGFAHLRSLPHRGPHHAIARIDAAELLGAHSGAKLVFLDPPYGDSVPYVEFSTLWNAFLGASADPREDLAVSDRARGDATWARYEAGLARVLDAARRALADDGAVVVTFNNRDLRAWGALLSAVQRAGLSCERAFHQPPAVVSTKARLAPAGSYVGDFWCAFRKSERAPSRDLGPIVDALRPGREDPQRDALDAFLRANVDASLLPELARLTKRACVDSPVDRHIQTNPKQIPTG